ncbi:MAG TPA: hypothetical protein PKC18_10970 [Lacipirellulaceae bacterium]|nr:hypothetical protein [Lacipirellulaceae bacterium]HMP05869.1 hypothetical protein [Lacipirellulaceae bacterium]
MRSSQINVRTLGNSIARVSAKSILRVGSTHSPLAPLFGALGAYAAAYGSAIGRTVKRWHTTTATRCRQVRVTGGACSFDMLQCAGRRMAMCRLAAS